MFFDRFITIFPFILYTQNPLILFVDADNCNSQSLSFYQSPSLLPILIFDLICSISIYILSITLIYIISSTNYIFIFTTFSLLLIQII